jgi:transposase
MSKEDGRKNPRARRTFTDEFKAGAVRLVLEGGKQLAEVARDLDLTPSSLGNWVKQAHADRSRGATGITSAERDELRELRRRVRVLEEERTILKKGLAFFAKESK